MRKYEKPIVKVVVLWQEDVLTGSGEYEKSSSLSDWFSGSFNSGNFVGKSLSTDFRGAEQ